MSLYAPPFAHSPGDIQLNLAQTSNWGVAPGALVVAGNSATYNATATNLITGTTAGTTNISHDAHGLFLGAYGSGTAGANHTRMFRIGVDPAGGTSYAWVVSDVICGHIEAAAAVNYFYFPIFIPAGSRVVMSQMTALASGSNGTRVFCQFMRQPLPPYGMAGQVAETIGSTAATVLGTAVTQGYWSGGVVWGAWTSLGTTTRNLWNWNLFVQANTDTANAEVCQIQLAYGDGATYTPIIESMCFTINTAERMQFIRNQLEGYKRAPAGATIYARIASMLTATGNAYNVCAVGIG